MSASDKKNSSGTILRILSFVFLLIALVAGYFFLKELQVYREGSSAYSSITDDVVSSGDVDEGFGFENTEQDDQSPEMTAEATTLNGTVQPPRTTLTADQKDYRRVRKLIKIDHDRLLEINPDAFGWIYLEGTRISYPIVQGQDNNYYLHHLVNNEYNKLGSIFMDYRNQKDFSDENTVIYGHNMNDGSMFYDLEKYKDPKFYQNHKNIYIILRDVLYRVEVFGAYVTNPADIGELTFNFDDVSKKTAYVEEAKRRSNFQAQVDVTDDDKIVSLMTCDYSTADGRYIVSGKLVPISEN